MPTFAHAAALADNTAAPGYRAEPVTKPTTPREYLPSARDGRRTESAKIAIRHLGKRNSIIDIETEIDQRDPSASIRSRRHHRTRLHRTERPRHIRRNIRPRQRTIINTHTRRRIDGHHQRQISGRGIVRQREDAWRFSAPQACPATRHPYPKTKPTCQRHHATRRPRQSPS